MLSYKCFPILLSLSFPKPLYPLQLILSAFSINLEVSSHYTFIKCIYLTDNKNSATGSLFSCRAVYPIVLIEELLQAYNSYSVMCMVNICPAFPQ